MKGHAGAARQDEWAQGWGRQWTEDLGGFHGLKKEAKQERQVYD